MNGHESNGARLPDDNMVAGADDSRNRIIVVSAILGAHIIAHVLLGSFGLTDLFDPLGILLLAGNIVIAFTVITGRRDTLLGAGMMFLVAAHSFLGRHIAPDPMTSGAILFVNMLVVYAGVKINLHLGSAEWFAFVASYLALFYLFIIHMQNAEALFLLFLMGLAATARSLKMLAYFWAFTLSFTFAQPYAWHALIISFLVLTALFGAKGGMRSTTAVIFLGVGLTLVMLVLLPVLIAMFGENPRNVITVLGDGRIRSAIYVTLITATISTAVLISFTVPLAYSVSRLRFPGRTLLLSLIDIPIVIPQSVAGIALVRIFGRQQFIGEILYHRFGINFDGTMLGIILAQIFVAMPFIARSAIAAFDAVPKGLELAARTLGASGWGAFVRVSLPLASRGVFLGAVLAWARAAGEFGAVIFIAPTPESAPVAAFNRFNAVGIVETGPLVATLLLFSLIMFFLLQFVSRTLPTVHGARGDES